MIQTEQAIEAIREVRAQIRALGDRGRRILRLPRLIRRRLLGA